MKRVVIHPLEQHSVCEIELTCACGRRDLENLDTTELTNVHTLKLNTETTPTLKLGCRCGKTYKVFLIWPEYTVEEVAG